MLSVSSTRMPGLNGLPVGKSFGWMTFLVAAVAETASARLSSRTVSLRILLSLHQRRRKRDQSGRNVLSVTCSNANGRFVGNLTRGNLVRRFDRAIRGRARGWYPANRGPHPPCTATRGAPSTSTGGRGAPWAGRALRADRVGPRPANRPSHNNRALR